LNAVRQLADSLDDRELGEATAASSDYSVLVRALEQPGAIATIQQEDVLAEARLRGIEMRERILTSEGGSSPPIKSPVT
jgi:hypothetical protein